MLKALVCLRRLSRLVREDAQCERHCWIYQARTFKDEGHSLGFLNFGPVYNRSVFLYCRALRRLYYMPGDIFEVECGGTLEGEGAGGPDGYCRPGRLLASVPRLYI
jgi:hypothetical protein